MATPSEISERDFHFLATEGFEDAVARRPVPTQDWRLGALPYGGHGRGDFGQPRATGAFPVEVRLVTPRQRAYEAGFEVGKQGGSRADLDAVASAEYGIWARCIGFSLRFKGLFDADTGSSVPTLFVALTSAEGVALAPEQTLSVQRSGRDVLTDQAALEPTLLFSTYGQLASTQQLVLRLHFDDDVACEFAFA